MVLVQVSNLRLALGIALKFYSSVAKGLKLKVRVLGANSYSWREVTGKKLVAWHFRKYLSLLILSKVKTQEF